MSTTTVLNHCVTYLCALDSRDSNIKSRDDWKTPDSNSEKSKNPFQNLQKISTEKTANMPNYGGSTEKCARCLKTVYLAEKKIGAGCSFHSKCFSCQTCNRKLDASTLSEHKGEIFCKTCYTRQFGVHGLISGVTMSTENPAREVRHSRRSSCSNELNPPEDKNEPRRPRAHSNENALIGEHGPLQHDDLPKLFPWRNEVLPEKHELPKVQKFDALNLLVEKPSQDRPKSQIGFQGIVETSDKSDKTLGERYSNFNEDDNRQKYIIPGEKISYSHVTSALVDMPMLPTKLADSSLSPTSPMTKSTELVHQTNSPSEQADIADNFSRLTLSEEHAKNIIGSVIISENPLVKSTDSLAKTYTTGEFSPTTETEKTKAQTEHSRESSPSTGTSHQRTESSTSGYTSTSVRSDRNSRSSTSPSATFVGLHDELNSFPMSFNSQTVSHRPLSPRATDRTSSAIEELASTSKPVRENVSPKTSTGQYSTLGALIKPLRPLGQHDEFNTNN